MERLRLWWSVGAITRKFQPTWRVRSHWSKIGERNSMWAHMGNLGGKSTKGKRGSHFAHHLSFLEIVFWHGTLEQWAKFACLVQHTRCFQAEIPTLASADFECQCKEGVSPSSNSFQQQRDCTTVGSMLQQRRDCAVLARGTPGSWGVRGVCGGDLEGRRSGSLLIGFAGIFGAFTNKIFRWVDFPSKRAI